MNVEGLWGIFPADSYQAPVQSWQGELATDKLKTSLFKGRVPFHLLDGSGKIDGRGGAACRDRGLQGVLY